MTKKVTIKENIEENTKEAPLSYSFYSRVLNKPFESLVDLESAETTYYAEQKAKEDKVAQKKADAQKVEDAFKVMNAARREYKEKLTQLTKEYAEELATLKKALELGKKDIQDALAAAEDNYANALKEFTSKYDSYHFTLRDGDFETTMTKMASAEPKKADTKDLSQVNLMNIFDLFFGL